MPINSIIGQSGILCLVGLVPLLTGCLLTGNKHVTAEYSRQVSVASARAAQVEGHLEHLESRLKNLEKTIRKQGKAEAERLENLDQVNAEISRLRGQIEEMSFVVQDMRLLYEQGVMVQERRQLHDEARLKQIEGFLSITAPPLPDVSGGDMAMSGTATEGVGVDSVESPEQGLEEFPVDAQGKLDLASTHMAAGRQALARVILQKAVEDHSGAPEMAEIRYRIGETWFNEKNWPKAIGSFEAVNNNHRKSNWSAWAMLRQGECFSAMGQVDNAKLFYEEVVRQHAKTDAAKQAKVLLQGK